MSREPSPGLAKGIPDEQDSQSIRTLQKRRRRRRRQRFRSRASLLSLLPCTLAQLLFSTSFCRAFVYSPLLRPSVSRQLAWMDRWTQSSGLQRDTREVSRARGRGNDWGGALFWDTRGGRTPEEPPAPLLSVTTFNVLAPIFKRVSSGRESDSRDSYLERNVRILRHLNVRSTSESKRYYSRCQRHIIKSPCTCTSTWNVHVLYGTHYSSNS